MSWVTVKDLQTNRTLYSSHEEWRKEALELTKDEDMSNLPMQKDFTPEQLELIKSTIAKGATNDELKLFLHRCSSLGLDPLKPGQIYFIKYGSGPGTIVVGLEGFRARAARTGKHSGTSRGVLRDEKGNCIGAWCEVSRNDWNKPAREEVSLHEYNTHKGNWTKMPETMIKKVAEAAALRMAFADDLGGIYVSEEMEQAEIEPKVVRVPVEGTIGKPALQQQVEKSLAAAYEHDTDPGEYVIDFGKKYKGQKIKNIDPSELASTINWYDGKAIESGKVYPTALSHLKTYFDLYVRSQIDGKPLDGQKSFDELDEDQPPF